MKFRDLVGHSRAYLNRLFVFDKIDGVMDDSLRRKNYLEALGKRFRPIDQAAGLPECMNKYGWPQNEISLILKLQSENSPRALELFNNLAELPQSSIDNTGKSDHEIVSEVPSKYIQLPSEIADTYERNTVQVEVEKKNEVLVEEPSSVESS